MSIITVRPGETVTVVGVALGPAGPVDPGYSPPWAQVPGGGQGGGPVDPGFSPPWAQVPPGQAGGGGGLRPSHPIALPGDPWWGTSPPTEPPPTEPPPSGSGELRLGLVGSTEPLGLGQGAGSG